MDSPDIFGGGGTPPSARRELRGPRPTPLSVSKDSHKIRKPPVAPHPFHAHRPAAPEAGDPPPPKPMIIYTVSPKVIHTTVSDFMLVVQRLTGSSSSSSSGASPAAAGAVSPAARMASIEKTSPSEREKERSVGDLMMGMGEGVVEVGRNNPGILSPAPASLPGISPEMFSPAFDPSTLSLAHDLSPFFSGNSFLPSPSSFFSAPLVSPNPSPDLFNQFFDF